MIRDLETRLAAVLSGRLPAPFANRVVAAPPPGPPGPNPQIVVGVRRVERLRPDMGHVRDEVVPGAAVPRRVLRLACTVEFVVRPANNQGRAQQLAGLDALLFSLDAPDMRSGSALGGPADPGFLLDAFDVVDATMPLDPTGPDAEPVSVVSLARGLFWPVGSAGQAGPRIVRLRLREGVLPVAVTLPPGGLVASGPAGTIEMRVTAAGTLELAAGQPPAHAPLGRLALRLASPEGGAGKGTLGGGVAGGEPGVRLVDLTGGTASVTYTPPDEAAVDDLVITLARGDVAGVELGRVPLRVEG